MKTEEQIKAKIQNLMKLLDDEENKTMVQQCKLWSAIDYLNWVIKD